MWKKDRSTDGIQKISFMEIVSLIRMPLFFVVIAAACRLRLGIVLLVSLVSLGMIPLKKRQNDREKDRQICLEDGDYYLEQLIYSFRRGHKIPAALNDVSDISAGRLRVCLLSAIRRLDSDIPEEDLFRSAFDRIEEQYGHDLMHLTHNFLIRVEEQGGDCNLALDLLLNQLRSQKKNRKQFESRRKSVQNRLVLSVVLSCLICLMMVWMMPSAFSVTDSVPYQACTGIGLLVFQLLYLGFSILLFCREETTKESSTEADRDRQGKKEKKYDRWHKWREKKQKHGGKQDSGKTGRKTDRKKDKGFQAGMQKKRMEREIQISFPEWMFDMILRLQTENVETSIRHSIEDAPEVLVYPLYQLSLQQQEDPVSIQPFQQFLSEYDLPEIHTMMLQLYAVNHMGKEEIQDQIHAMLDQNQIMTETAWEMRADSVLSGTGLLAAVPMLVSVIVLVIDMSLMLFSFLGNLQPL